MSDPHWEHLKKIFHAAVALPPQDRATYLDKVCDGDLSLRAAVESLLKSHEETGNFVDAPAYQAPANMLTDGVEFKAGQTVTHYKILSLLGEGGMGTVYLAEDTRLHRKVSLKFLSQSLTDDRQRMRRFEQEARAVSALNHPNTLTIHEISEVNGRRFIAAEYIEGQTLREHMRSGLDIEDAIDIAIQIASALVAAHRVNIVHRDIKPENIMIRTDDRLVKVLDFGLSKMGQRSSSNAPADSKLDTLLMANTAPGVVMGTVAYMSPEQARGETVDERTDIWSLGVVLYEMVAGCSPFVASTSNEIISTILSKTSAPPLARFAHNVPLRLEEIVEKALTKNKDERYQTSKDLIIDLKRLQQTLQLKAASERNASPDKTGVSPSGRRVNSAGTSERATPNALPASSADYIVNQVGRRKRAALTSLTLLLLIVAGMFIYIWRIRQTAAPAQPEITSLVVLPLKNISGDAQDEYLSDGITDELITKLTKIKSVRVVSPSVAMRYKNSPKDAAEIARELNVQAAIEGTVRKVGTRFRLSIHLVNAQDGFEIWSDNDFENELDNLLDAERQIAEAVASRLKGQLTAQERTLVASRSTTSADAYEIYLRGKQHARAREWQLARELFDRAIQLDPNFVDAYAWRGRVIYQLFADGIGSRATLDAALSDANRALRLDPNIITARRTLIFIYHSTGQTEEGLKQGKQILEINPHDLDAMEGAALAYFRAGMINKSIPLYQRAIAADPTNEEIRSWLARCYTRTGEYQKGIDVLLPVLAKNQGGWWMAMQNYRGLQQFDKAIEMGKILTSRQPDQAVGWLDLGRVLKAAGKPEQAREVWAEGARREEAKVATFENVRTRVWLSYFYAHLGEREKALAQVSRALALEPNDAWTLFQVGTVHALLNNRREAVGYIKQSIAQGWLGIHYIDYDLDPNGGSSLVNLRDDAEFQHVRADLQRKIDELAAQY